jgi:hypothetical protein
MDDFSYPQRNHTRHFRFPGTREGVRVKPELLGYLKDRLHYVDPLVRYLRRGGYRANAITTTARQQSSFAKISGPGLEVLGVVSAQM